MVQFSTKSVTWSPYALVNFAWIDPVVMGHTILALSVISLSCSPKLGIAHKKWLGVRFRKEWLIRTSKIFSNTNNHLKI